jgi:DNA modification methylase
MSTDHQVLCGDCLDIVSALEPGSIDLVFCSPPYGPLRTYGIGFDLKGPEWVNWAADRFEACYAACNGLTAWVVGGYTRKFRWFALPVLLQAELLKRGVVLRDPPIMHRVGVPGSGGPDWLRHDYETIISAAMGKLPWSDNTACGHEPKYGPGGSPSHRMVNGERVGCKSTDRRPSGELKPRYYKPPSRSNPGNVIKVKVGGGLMGSLIAHEGEAAFPEEIAEFFIKSFCPPGGLVLDPFSGSGTTAKVAKKLGRRSLSIDIRESQCELTRRRLLEVPDELPVGGEAVA